MGLFNTLSDAAEILQSGELPDHMDDATSALVHLLRHVIEGYMSGEGGLSDAGDAVVLHLMNPNEDLVRDMTVMERQQVWMVCNTLRKAKESLRAQRAKEADEAAAPAPDAR